MVSPDGTVLLAPDSLLPKQGSVLHFHGHLRFSSTCYFIRTLRPLQAPEKSSHPHFVPLQSLRLQATVTGNVYGPDCTSGGELIPVPVTRTRPAPSADEASP